MKRKTYNVLKHIPIIGYIVEKITINPMITGSFARSDSKYIEEVIKPFNKYLKKHPELYPTRQLFRKWIRRNSK